MGSGSWGGEEPKWAEGRGPHPDVLTPQSKLLASAVYPAGAHVDGVSLLMLKNARHGVPVMVQWKQIQLGTMRLQVQFLTSLSGLRIQCCHELWYKSQMQLRSCIAVALV